MREPPSGSLVRVGAHTCSSFTQELPGLVEGGSSGVGAGEPGPRRQVLEQRGGLSIQMPLSPAAPSPSNPVAAACAQTQPEG